MLDPRVRVLHATLAGVRDDSASAEMTLAGMSPRVLDGSGMSHLKGTPPQPKMQKLGSISFGSWWCGAGNDPRTSPL